MWIHPGVPDEEPTPPRRDAFSEERQAKPPTMVTWQRCLRTLLHPRSPKEEEDTREILARIEKEGPGIFGERSR